MNNQLERMGSLTQREQMCSLTQKAEKITNIENVENIQQTNNVVVMTASNSRKTPLSRDYYNLIVWGAEPFFEKRHVTISKDRALVELEYISPELKARFSPLSPEAINDLKSFPCIIANENQFYSRAADSQYALLAIITDIRKRSNGIEIYFQQFQELPQQAINELITELGIKGVRGFHELSHSHWTVKEIDLLEVLSEHELTMF